MKNRESSRSSEDDMQHYVKGSLRQKGYYRKRPYTYDQPTKDQRKARAQFGVIAHEQGIDKTGKVEIVDNKGQEKEVPASAVPIMQNMKPVAAPKPERIPVVSPLERLKRFSEIIARIEQST